MHKHVNSPPFTGPSTVHTRHALPKLLPSPAASTELPLADSHTVGVWVWISGTDALS